MRDIEIGFCFCALIYPTLLDSKMLALGSQEISFHREAVHGTGGHIAFVLLEKDFLNCMRCLLVSPTLVTALWSNDEGQGCRTAFSKLRNGASCKQIRSLQVRWMAGKLFLGNGHLLELYLWRYVERCGGVWKKTLSVSGTRFWHGHRLIHLPLVA